MELIFSIVDAAVWIAIGIATVMLYIGTPLIWWCAYSLFFWLFFLIPNYVEFFTFFFALFFLTSLLLIKSLRKAVLSSPILLLVRKLKVVPKISETERLSVKSGTTWMDMEIFSGRPNRDTLTSHPLSELSKEEKDFLSGPVEKVAEMTSDWQVHQKRGLNVATWEYLKKNKFFGMIIPKRYGGLEFSRKGHATVIKKLASRSHPLSISVMVPNSLGPAELLLHYGTEKQKDHYLPRLADGREIPCFVHRELDRGLDNGMGTSHGEVIETKKNKFAIKLNFENQHIPLAAISTIIGLTFRLHDPKNLMGKGTDLGTCIALIPSKKKGIRLGRRHDPLNVPFYDCPISGKDVTIGVDSLIGGESGIGMGLRMVAESAVASRGVSMPAIATGSSKWVARVVSAYTKVGKKFDSELYKSESIEEKLASIYGNTYQMNATLEYIIKALNDGEKPPVISTICEYQFVNKNRQIVNAGMDILGRASISRGPKNFLAHSYFAAPISTPSESITARSPIIFYQGVMHCHPYFYPLICSIEKNDVDAFDLNLLGLLARFTRNKIRFLLLTFTKGFFSLNMVFQKNGTYWRKLMWASATLAFWSDSFTIALAGKTKFRERISGRLGDVFSELLLACATLNYYEKGNCPKDEGVSFKWVMEQCFYNIDIAMKDFYDNFFRSEISILKPLNFVYRLFFSIISNLLPFGKKPSASLEKALVGQYANDKKFRNLATDGIYLSKDKNSPLNFLENSMNLLENSNKIMEKMKTKLQKKGLPYDRYDLPQSIHMAVTKNLISANEAKTLLVAEKARKQAMMVDSFSPKQYQEYGIKVAP